ANPSNPDPGATVRTGKQNTDEMFNGYFDVALVDQDPSRASSGPWMTWLLMRWSASLPIRVGALVLVLGACGLVLRRLGTQQNIGSLRMGGCVGFMQHWNPRRQES